MFCLIVSGLVKVIHVPPPCATTVIVLLIFVLKNCSTLVSADCRFCFTPIRSGAPVINELFSGILHYRLHFLKDISSWGSIIQFTNREAKVASAIVLAGNCNVPYLPTYLSLIVDQNKKIGRFLGDKTGLFRFLPMTLSPGHRTLGITSIVFPPKKLSKNLFT